MIKKLDGFFFNGNFFALDADDEYFLDDILKKFLKKKINTRIAVAVNNKLVERLNWKKKKIFLNDKIEVVAPFNGG